MTISTDRRNKMEEQIALLVVILMLGAGYTVLVDNGGDEDEHEKIVVASDAAGKLRLTDSDMLIAVGANGDPVGWVQLVYGNSGYDTLADYTTNLEPLLMAVHELGDKFEKEAK